MYKGIGIGVALLLASQVLHAQNTAVTISICNTGNTTLSVARATEAGFWTYRDPAWLVDGWVEIPAGGFLNNCRNLDSKGWAGTYHFAFMLTGRNGKGLVRYDSQNRGRTGFQNSNGRFCVDPTQAFWMEAINREGIEDLDNCPSGRVLVPFSTSIYTTPGGSYTLEINADRSSEVALLTPPKPPEEVKLTLDVSSLELNQPSFAQRLIDDEHEYVQIQGLEGVYYAYGAYRMGIKLCATLKTIEATPFQLTGLGLGRFLQQLVQDVQSLLRGSNDLLTRNRLEGRDLESFFGEMNDIVTINRLVIPDGGRDFEAIRSAWGGCDAPGTRAFFAGAEKIVEAMLRLRGADRALLTRYVRPARFDGLPEETKQLYDGYYLCQVRTGQTDQLASFGSCDEALFQFRVSEARATGQPLPTRRLPPIRAWTSERGPIGELQERSYGTDIRISTAPADFTPEIPDTRAIKLPLVFYLDFNDGNRDKIFRVSLTRITFSGVYGRSPMRFQGRARDLVGEDYTALRNLGFGQPLLDCTYYVDERRSFSAYYWYKSRPALADPERLRSRMSNHPLLLILGVREDCPATLTAETRAEIQSLLRN